MQKFVDMLKDNIDAIQNVLDSAEEHLKSSTLSRVFLFIICLIALINIAKSFLIWWERKHNVRNEPCQYLIIQRGEQECGIPSRQQGFRDRGYSCQGCAGRTSCLTPQEAEKFASSAYAWKRWVFCIANCGKTALPYISFVYTLLVVIFAK